MTFNLSLRNDELDGVWDAPEIGEKGTIAIKKVTKGGSNNESE